jgi:hypothetical protein
MTLGHSTENKVLRKINMWKDEVSEQFKDIA